MSDAPRTLEESAGGRGAESREPPPRNGRLGVGRNVFPTGCEAGVRRLRWRDGGTLGCTVVERNQRVPLPSRNWSRLRRHRGWLCRRTTDAAVHDHGPRTHQRFDRHRGCARRTSSPYRGVCAYVRVIQGAICDPRELSHDVASFAVRLRTAVSLRNRHRGLRPTRIPRAGARGRPEPPERFRRSSGAGHRRAARLRQPTAHSTVSGSVGSKHRRATRSPPASTLLVMARLRSGSATERAMPPPTLRHSRVACGRR